jgi:hypothetical protein
VSLCFPHWKGAIRFAVAGPIVEAFPNAFLGVLTSEVELLSAPKLKRGRRFDWLYEQITTTGRLEMPDELWLRLRTEKDRDLLEALICLLTASSGGARHGHNNWRIDRRLVLATTVDVVAAVGNERT